MNDKNNYQAGTVSATFVSLFLRTAQEYGISPANALAACHLPGDLLENPSSRIDAFEFEALLRWLIVRCDDRLFGFNSARQLVPGAFGVLGYVIMNCESSGDAIRMVPRYEALIGNLGTTELHESDDVVALRWSSSCGDPIVRTHLVDEYMSTTVGFARWVTGRDDIHPNRIYFEHKAPSAPVLETLKNYYRCELIFDAKTNVMEFSPSLMSLPIQHPDPTLLRTLQEQADRQFRELQQCDPVVIQVRATLESMMERTIPRRERVASKLGMSERTLQRRLLEAGSSYQQILDELRLELASSWLLRKDWPVADIALRLGFTEPRSFQRRFKSWTGKSPGEFRRGGHEDSRSELKAQAVS